MIKGLNRFKAIKDLILGKLDEILVKLNQLDDLQQSVQQLNTSVRRLEKVSESQLANDASLLQASIHTVQLLQGTQGASSAWLLLGNADEVAIAQSRLPLPNPCPSQDWDWYQPPDLSALSDTTQVIVCKLPTEAHHWDALQKLQQQLPNSVLLIAGLPPTPPL